MLRFLALIALSALPTVTLAAPTAGTYRVVARTPSQGFARGWRILGHLHANDFENNDHLVSTRYQPLDAYTEFRLFPEQDGSFRMGVRASNRFWALDAGARVQTQTEPGAQRFEVVAVGGSAYTLKARSNGRFLRLDDQQVLKADADAGAAQLFMFDRLETCDSSQLRWSQVMRPNLAHGRPSRQSSTHSSGGGQDRATFGADGDICGRFAQTNQETGQVPFWEIDLGAERTVEALLVFRGNPVMNGAVVATSSTASGDALMVPGPAVTHYRMTNDRLTILQPQVDMSVPGAMNAVSGGRVQLDRLPPEATRHLRMRYIRIFHPRKSGQISLHELVVIGQ